MPEDFHGFLTEEKAKEAFHYIDDNDSGRVAQSELLNAVVQIFRCSQTNARAHSVLAVNMCNDTHIDNSQQLQPAEPQAADEKSCDAPQTGCELDIPSR